MKSIKILSYNIHKGFSIGNRKFILNGIKNAIDEIKPDILFLQEVVGSHSSKRHIIEGWDNKIQFEFLSKELCNYYAYGKNAVYTKGDHGNAILSRFPISFHENINISTNRFEKRGVLHTIIDIPHNDTVFKLHGLCLHLNLLESGRRVQIEKVCQRVKNTVKENEAIILAGDFNDWQVNISSILEEKLELKDAHYAKFGKHARTFPSTSPVMCLDRVYFKNLGLENVEVLKGKVWRKLSDHVGILAEFHIV